MTDDTTRTLSLPYLQPGQALKTITHNEALQRLDAGLYLSISNMAAAELPLEPTEGDALIIAENPSAELTTRAGHIAVSVAGVWTWFAPSPGWIIWDETSQNLRVYDGAAWVSGTASSMSDILPKLGVNTSAQDHQRLAVSSDSSLFTHAGESHRLTLNRAADSDTASLIFQTGFSGQAEFGLTGTSGLSLRTSPDGANWSDRLSAPDDYPGLRAPAFGSLRLFIDSNDAAFIPTPETGGLVAIIIVSEAGLTRADRSGLLAYDTGQSPGLVSLATTALLINHGSTPLDGTVGQNNRIGVSAVEGGLYVENKLPTQREFSLTFLC